MNQTTLHTQGHEPLVLLPTDQLIIDPQIQIRRELDPKRIERYMEIFEQLPPVTGVSDGEQLLLANGMHRLEAAKRLGLSQIWVRLIQGNKQLAEELSITENAWDSAPFTDEERRAAVSKLCVLHPEWKEPRYHSKVAHAAGVSVMTVERVLRVTALLEAVPDAAALSFRQQAEIAAVKNKKYWPKLVRIAAPPEHGGRGWHYRTIIDARRDLEELDRALQYSDLGDPIRAQYIKAKRNLLAGRCDPTSRESPRSSIARAETAGTTHNGTRLRSETIAHRLNQALEQKKKRHSLRFIEMDNALHQMHERGLKATHAGEDVPFTEEERQLLGYTLTRVRRVVDLLDEMVMGQRSADWQEKLHVIEGGVAL